MKRGWNQRWENVLFQHFEIENVSILEKKLPKGCTLDTYDGKYYIGLVSMQMCNVRHRSIKDIVWFKRYNELNVRSYIRHNGEPGVLFLSLDVDSLISVLGARLLYGLPYRLRSFVVKGSDVMSYKNNKEELKLQYNVQEEVQSHDEKSFACWATERYFFANKYMGVSFRGNIMHKPWKLSNATAVNKNLNVMAPYTLGTQHPQTLFCKALDVTTSELKRI